MTITEFEKHNKNKDMPCEWIGQGVGYKAEWDPKRPTDIIYIPEHGYDEDECTVPRENAYSYNDFMELCDGNEKKAEAVFNNADWQFPNSIPEEPWFKWDE